MIAAWRAGAGAAGDLEQEMDMEDILTRILIGGLGVLLMLLAISILVAQGIARSLRSIFAPRVIIVQNDSTHERQPGLVETYKPMVTAFIWLILMLVFFGHGPR
jgi:hypothetical protein